MSYYARGITHNKKTSQSRCVGTRHHRCLAQTDNVDRAVSRLMIMGNLKDIISINPRRGTAQLTLLVWMEIF